jgi:hypothetical protein
VPPVLANKWPELYERTAPRHNYVGVPSPLSLRVEAELIGYCRERLRASFTDHYRDADVSG